MKNEYISLYIRHSNIFLKTGRSETVRWFLTFCLSSRLWIGTTMAIFHSVWNIPDSIQEEKMECNDFQIVLLQICNLQMLIWSSPCALLGRNFLITLKISYSVKVIVFKDSLGRCIIWIGKLLPVSLWVYCFKRNRLNNSLFSLKATADWWLWIKGGIQGIFLLLRNRFNMDQ